MSIASEYRKFGLKEVNNHDQKVSVVTITPEAAQEILEKANTHNRRLKGALLQALVQEVKRGEWRLNGEAVIFDEHGNLLDGQHRLEACVKAETPFETYVVEGVSAPDQVTIDSGVSRSAADALRLAGYPNEMVLGGLCRISLAYEQQVSLNNIKLQAREAVEMANRDPNLSRSVNDMPSMKLRSTFALIHYIAGIKHNNPDMSLDFIHGCHTGHMLPAGDPRLALRNRLHAQQSIVATANTPRLLSYLTVRAWNGFFNDEEIYKLQQPWTGRPVIRIEPDRRESVGLVGHVIGRNLKTS